MILFSRTLCGSTISPVSAKKDFSWSNSLAHLRLKILQYPNVLGGLVLPSLQLYYAAQLSHIRTLFAHPSVHNPKLMSYDSRLGPWLLVLFLLAGGREPTLPQNTTRRQTLLM